MLPQWASNRDYSNLISNDAWGQDRYNLKSCFSLSSRSKRDSKYISHKRSVLCLCDIIWSSFTKSVWEQWGRERKSSPLCHVLNPLTWNIAEDLTEKNIYCHSTLLGHKNYKSPNFMSAESQVLHVGNNISINND